MPIAMLPAGARHPILERLVQLYLYDLSEVDGRDLNDSGYFEDAELDAFWREPEQHAFVIHNDRQPIGFVLVSCRSRIQQAFEGYSLRAIFIVRRWRRQGCGREAAFQLLDRFPGHWEIATSSSNVPAIAFWRSVADSYTGGRYDEMWHQDGAWRGPVQRFDAPAKPQPH
jgi:predicted acetyltransferase